MNEQLQQALATILGKTMDGIDAGVAFMQAELPDVIQQLLLWYGVKSAIMCVLGFILILIFLGVDKKMFKMYKDDEDLLFVGYFMLGSIVRLVYLVPLAMMNLEWLQIWIAPKIWLIEYAANLAK